MRVFLPRMPLQTIKNLGRPSYGSSKNTYDTPEADKTWPGSYDMMHGDEIPLKEPRTDNTILAERGEATAKDRAMENSQSLDTAGVINVQKEIIVT